MNVSKKPYVYQEQPLTTYYQEFGTNYKDRRYVKNQSLPNFVLEGGNISIALLKWWDLDLQQFAQLSMKLMRPLFLVYGKNALLPISLQMKTS